MEGEASHVGKLERRRRARLGSFMDNGFTLLAALVTGGGGLIGGITLTHHGQSWWTAALAGIPFAFALGAIVVVVACSLMDTVEVKDRDAARRLIAARDVWKSLPADLQDRTRPIIDAAYTAAGLPRDAVTQVGHRLTLLQKFADEAARQKRDLAMQALGQDDLDAGETYLMELHRLQQPPGGGI